MVWAKFYMGSSSTIYPCRPELEELVAIGKAIDKVLRQHKGRKP